MHLIQLSGDMTRKNNPNFSSEFKLESVQQHSTLGAHPDKSEWFHCTRIHTTMNDWLGIPKNNALNCTEN
jgi:hypothetical protein